MADYVAVFRTACEAAQVDVSAMTDVQARFWIDQGAARAADALTDIGLSPADPNYRLAANVIVTAMLHCLQAEIEDATTPDVSHACIRTYFWLLPWHQATAIPTEGETSE